MPTKVPVDGLVQLIRSLAPEFKYFHLSPCWCGLPSWQQPCPWCNFYPMGQTEALKLGGCECRTNHAFASVFIFKQKMGKRSIFACYCDRMANSCDPAFNERMKALKVQLDGLYEWPTAEEIFDQYGPNAPRRQWERGINTPPEIFPHPPIFTVPARQSDAGAWMNLGGHWVKERK